MADVFVDTNVLVYARDLSDRSKQRRAAAWVETLFRQRTGRLSQQVLHEYYVTVTRKLRPGLGRDAAREDVRSLLAWRPIPSDATLLERAWIVEDRFGLSWWDAMIVAAAQIGTCGRLLTEDLQAGQDLDGVVVVSPFETEPE